MSEKARREAEELVEDAQRGAAAMLSDAEQELARLASERERLEALAEGLQQDLSSFLMETLERLKAKPKELDAPPSLRGVEDTERPGEPSGGDKTSQKPARAARTAPRPRSASD